MQMLRTTVYLPESLVEAAKFEALARKTNLTKLVEAGLKKELQTKVPKKRKFVWKTYDLGNPTYVFKRSDAYE